MKTRAVFFVLFILLMPQGVGAADKLLVGVAANYLLAFKELAVAFERKSVIVVRPTFAATGNLYSQIKAGAPYDLFLAADEARPEDLFRQNMAERPFIYATGRLVLWSDRRDGCSAKTWQDALKGRLKIAIPSPDTAPYGAVARSTLRCAGLWETLRPYLVYAQDVSQAFQYAAVKGTAMAFLSRSFAWSEQGKQGCHYLIEEAPPIRQAGCILKRTRQRKAAEAFAAFLASPEAAAIREKYGYE